MSGGYSEYAVQGVHPPKYTLDDLERYLGNTENPDFGFVRKFCFNFIQNSYRKSRGLPLYDSSFIELVNVLLRHKCWDFRLMNQICLYAINYAYEVEVSALADFNLFCNKSRKSRISKKCSLMISDRTLVGECLESANMKLLELFMRCGYQFQYPEDNDQSRWKVVTYVTRLFYGERMKSFNDRYFEYSLLWNFNDQSRRRLHLVMTSIEIYARTMTPGKYLIKNVDRHVQCLSLIFQSIPDPEISSQEVEEVLEKLLRGAKFEKTVQEVKAEYERCFPESVKAPSPRTLKHLSRCQIRQNFSQAGCLPQIGIDALFIHQRLKNYILLY